MHEHLLIFWNLCNVTKTFSKYDLAYLGKKTIVQHETYTNVSNSPEIINIT
jgi:hypothetical protein